MGSWTQLWTAMGYLCTLGQVIMILDRHWSLMLSLREKLVLASPQLPATNSYCLLTGRFSLAVGGHRDLLPTIGVALLMCILGGCGASSLERKLDEHEHSCWTAGWMTQKKLLPCVFAVLVALNVSLGLSSGTIVTCLVSTLVVAFADVEFAKYCPEGWTPLVDGSSFCGLLFVYYGLIGLSALLVSIHSFLGWSSGSYFTLAVALLLGARYSVREQLNWSAVHRLVSQAAVIYVLWKVLSALAVAIHLSAWLSPEIFFKLVAASVALGILLGAPESLPTIIEEVSSFCSEESHKFLLGVISRRFRCFC